MEQKVPVLWTEQPATTVSGPSGHFSLHCREVPPFWKSPDLPWEEAVGVARAQQPEPPVHQAPSDQWTPCQHRPGHSSRAPKVLVSEATDSLEPSTIPHSSSPFRVKIYPQQQRLGSRHPSPGNRSTAQQLRPISKNYSKS
uniref:Uncharacterized protein n=1 Tax=Molossus molossus TaxID=27622 RepID=A0A7J8DPQ7_MOLMO|nr:hypothetical protein HJG59_009257 [Molossus molossus]